MATNYDNKFWQSTRSTTHVSTNQGNKSASTNYVSTNYISNVGLHIMSTCSVDKFWVNKLSKHVARNNPKEFRIGQGISNSSQQTRSSYHVN